MILLLCVTFFKCFLVTAAETGNQLGKITILSTLQGLFFSDRVLEKPPRCPMALQSLSDTTRAS